MGSVACKDAQREEVFKDLNLSVYESKELVTTRSHRVQRGTRNEPSFNLETPVLRTPEVDHRLLLRTRSIHDKIRELKTLRLDVVGFHAFQAL